MCTMIITLKYCSSNVTMWDDVVVTKMEQCCFIENQVVRVPGSTPLLCPSTEACKCKDDCLPKEMIPQYPKLISNYLDIDQTFGS